jgi:hypothetical protein
VARLFILFTKTARPHSPRNQLVVPKTNQEIKEPSYEMVGVKITVTNGGGLAVFVNKINNLANQSWKKISGLCFIEKKKKTGLNRVNNVITCPALCVE